MLSYLSQTIIFNISFRLLSFAIYKLRLLNSPRLQCTPSAQNPSPWSATPQERCRYWATEAAACPGLCQRSCTGGHGCGCPPFLAWETHCSAGSHEGLSDTCWYYIESIMDKTLAYCKHLLSNPLGKDITCFSSTYSCDSCITCEGLNPNTPLSLSCSPPLPMKAIWPE